MPFNKKKCLGIIETLNSVLIKNVIGEFFKSFYFSKNWFVFETFSHNNHIIAMDKVKEEFVTFKDILEEYGRRYNNIY